MRASPSCPGNRSARSRALWRRVRAILTSARASASCSSKASTSGTVSAMAIPLRCSRRAAMQRRLTAVRQDGSGTGRGSVPTARLSTAAGWRNGRPIHSGGFGAKCDGCYAGRTTRLSPPRSCGWLPPSPEGRMSMPLDHWLALAAASGVLLAIPGPTVLLVISYALAHARRSAAAIVAGIALGDLTAMTASVLGLGAALAASAAVFTALRWIGGAYLVYLGVRLCRAPVQAADT